MCSLYQAVADIAIEVIIDISSVIPQIKAATNHFGQERAWETVSKA